MLSGGRPRHELTIIHRTFGAGASLPGRQHDELHGGVLLVRKSLTARPVFGMRVLFVTRKYPPRIGGMESLSHGLTTGFPEPKTIIALGRSQRHLVWFLPYVIARVALTAHRYDVIHLGDALLCSAGLVPRVLLKRKVAVS